MSLKEQLEKLCEEESLLAQQREKVDKLRQELNQSLMDRAKKLAGPSSRTVEVSGVGCFTEPRQVVGEKWLDERYGGVRLIVVDQDGSVYSASAFDREYKHFDAGWSSEVSEVSTENLRLYFKPLFDE